MMDTTSFSELDTKRVKRLLHELTEQKRKLREWHPKVRRMEIEETIDEIEEEIIDLLKDADLTRAEIGDYTISIRKVPTYFVITSRRRLEAALKRKRLTRFLIPSYTIDLRGLKEYLLATGTTLPGLRRVDDDMSLYVYKKAAETQPDLFITKGVDEDLANPATRWRQLIADLRYLANSAYPRLKEGKQWGEWSLDEVKQYFAKIVDALRSVYFVIPERKDGSSFWELYWLAKPLMKSEPPKKKEEIAEWDRKRKEIIKTAEDYYGIYLVPPHGLLLHSGEKTAIVKSINFSSHIGEPLYLISDNYCYGVIMLSGPEEIDKERFLEEFDNHCITTEERKSWWDETWPLYLYRVKWVERYTEPVVVRIPKGIQTFIAPDSIQMEV